MANKYSGIIDNLTWSYSSLSLYNQCPYAWFLKYIYRKPAVKNVFAVFGRHIHSAIEEYYQRQTDVSILNARFVKDFTSFCMLYNIKPKEMFDLIRIGTQYIKNISQSELNNYIGSKTVYEIEKKEDFFLNNYKFTCVIDMLLEDNGEFIVLDHKSYSLYNDFSSKAVGKYIDLHKYLIQQYLYAECVHQHKGKYPLRIAFNCFKKENRQVVDVNFNYVDFVLSKEWALSTIKAIENDNEWKHRYNYWFCGHLCGYRYSCEYSDVRRK